jgi:predicted nucleic acid-binding protein
LILVDANVLMYAIGADYAHKGPCIRLLERIGAGQVEAAVDAETLQQLLHRYRSLNRWPDAEQVYALTRRLFPSVLPITGAVVDQAQVLMRRHRELSALVAVHAAVVAVDDLDGICSYDQDFDIIAGLRRVPQDAFLA